jgi:hypothetical protein
VAGEDLSSITGMEDKHRRALARRQITTLRGLAGADQHVIYRAMGSIEPRREGPQLRIDSATITDAAGSSYLVTDGTPVADPPAELVAPALVVFTVSGARRGTEVQAVARLRGHGEPGRNVADPVADPVAVPASGRAGFDLSRVAAGQLEMTLLAWTPDCTASTYRSTCLR